MGMPVITCCDVDKCCAAASLLQSIALEEAALAHILNAEGEKLQKALCLPKVEFCDLISINESAAALIDKVQKLEDTLREKLVLIVPLLCDKDKPKQPCDHK